MSTTYGRRRNGSIVLCDFLFSSRGFVGSVMICLAIGLGEHSTACFGEEFDPQVVSLYHEMTTNLNYFEAYKCAFRYGQFFADSVENAIGKKIPDDLPYCQRYELHCLGVDYCIRSQGGSAYANQQYDNSFPPVMTLVRNGIAMDFNAALNNSIVNIKTSSHPQTTFHPLNYAGTSDECSPITLLSLLIAEHASFFTASVEDETQGSEVFKRLNLRGEATGVELTYWLDPKKGMLPVKIEQRDITTNKLVSVTHVVDFFKINEHFYPKESRLLFPRENVEVRFVSVDLFDPAYIPTEEDLSLLLPQHTQFWDGVDPNTSKTVFRYAEDEFISVNQDAVKHIYEGMFEIAAERTTAEKKKKEALVMANESSDSSSGVFLVVNLCVIAIIGVLMVFFRRRP